MKNICHNFYRTIIFNASALYGRKIFKDTKIIREKQVGGTLLIIERK